MQLAGLQKQAAQAIVNIFETGSVRGNYADVTLLRGDSGQLTYGRSQTTLASGNLYLLIKSYAERTDGAYCEALRPFLELLEACDSTLNHHTPFRSLLKDAGDDPVMHEVQDTFFDRVYWEPAMRSAQALGVQSALGAAIVYDGTVHGSWARIRDRTRKQFGELRDIGEDKWMAHYVDQRREWLATHPNALLHKTVYRMDAFKQIIHHGNWKLNLPLSVRGLAISPDTMNAAVPVKVSAEGTPRRLLKLKNPPLSGPDVAWLQERLTRAGCQVAQTGTFDEATDAAVRAFQDSQDLKADGLVGAVTRTALEDISVTAPSHDHAIDEPMPAIARADAGNLTIIAPTIMVADPTSTGATPAGAPTPTGESAADIKKHVSNEVRTGIESIRKTVVETLAGRTVDAGTTKDIHLPSVSTMVKGRPAIAAAASALMLAFTEARDAIAWVQAGLAKGAPPVPTAGPATTQLPTSMSQVEQFFTQGWAYVHGLAAALPNEWVFRIRVLAFVLICYAIYRLGVRHWDLRRLQKRLAEVQKLEQRIEHAVK